MKLKSERGMPLFVMDGADKPYLTVEDYGKWYSAYLVLPSGTVLKYWPCDAMQKKAGVQYFMRGDHCFHADDFVAVAKAEGFLVCPDALKEITERWQRYLE